MISVSDVHYKGTRLAVQRGLRLIGINPNSNVIKEQIPACSEKYVKIYYILS